MMNSLEQEYNKILDDGFAITELYIYSLLKEDGRSFGLTDQEFNDKMVSIQELRSRSNLPLEDIVDRILDGDDYFTGDEDEEWY